ncbi:class B sortase [Paenibacillus sp. UNC451MF]|uniref:class B sortase n=1 Tax=Paenibacillus sp. UNC451MF TaxID=1449063 RepID=UPI00048E85CC|nr:class B sortase [Paenibacillus sp. UNC451MF]
MNWRSACQISMIALSAAGIAYSIYHLVFEYADNRQVMAEARSIYSSSAAQEQAETPKDEVRPRFKELLEVSPDLVGWLRLHDTLIDYPIVQGKDNDYYLSRNYKREEMKSGSIFMDYRNKSPETELNTVIYGHNMRDGSMFGQLKQYTDPDFLQSHPTFTYETLHDDYVAEIFSVYYTTTENDYIQTQFNGEEEYDSFLQTIRKRSLYKTETVLTENSLILTLSTCDSTLDPEEGRLALHAMLIKRQKPTP